MTERNWYPSFLIDEVLPVGRPSAEAWLPALLTHRAPFERGWDRPRSGDVIDFQYYEPRGNIEVTINPDASVSVTQRCPETKDMFSGTPGGTVNENAEIDPPANSFWDLESETLAGSLEEFAEYYLALDTIDEPVSVTVTATYWSDKISFRISDDCQFLIPIPSPANAAAQENHTC